MTATTWNFDTTHSTVNFTVRHLMVTKVHGSFKTWSGSLSFDDADISKSHFEASIDAASVDTKEEKRDAHLRAPDFFDAEKFPKLTFKSTKIVKKGDEEATVTGDLTIHGVTKSVDIAVEINGEVKDPWGGTRRGFTGKTSISRKDFGMTFNAALDAGGVMVGDKIDITLEIQAVKAA
jgi:polyisoprenoid-binding protein YceI